jgi:glutaredoxin
MDTYRIIEDDNEEYLYILVPTTSDYFKVGIAKSRKNRWKQLSSTYQLEFNLRKSFYIASNSRDLVSDIEDAIKKIFRKFNDFKKEWEGLSGYQEWFNRECLNALLEEVNHLVQTHYHDNVSLLEPFIDHSKLYMIVEFLNIPQYEYCEFDKNLLEDESFNFLKVVESKDKADEWLRKNKNYNVGYYSLNEFRIASIFEYQKLKPRFIELQGKTRKPKNKKIMINRANKGLYQESLKIISKRHKLKANYIFADSNALVQSDGKRAPKGFYHFFENEIDNRQIKEDKETLHMKSELELMEFLFIETMCEFKKLYEKTIKEFTDSLYIVSADFLCKWEESSS